MGATHVVNSSDADFHKKVLELVPRGVDVSIDWYDRFPVSFFTLCSLSYLFIFSLLSNCIASFTLQSCCSLSL